MKISSMKRHGFEIIRMQKEKPKIWKTPIYDSIKILSKVQIYYGFNEIVAENGSENSTGNIFYFRMKLGII